MLKNSKDLDSVKDAILRGDAFTLLGHTIPDGDCVGAVTAMLWALKAMGKEVTAVIEDEVPKTYRFLPGVDQIGSESSLPRLHRCHIYLDCATRDRVGAKLLGHLTRCDTVINIDHHISNERYGDFNLVDGKASSTCEIIFNLLKSMDVLITGEIAVSLYCGIVMDTGSFQYPSTTPSTHRAVAELLESGFNYDQVRTNLFESKSRVEVAMQKKALESLEFSDDGRVAYMVLSHRDLQELGAVGQHFEGTINLARNIENVEVALLFREIEPGRVKVGFRSKLRVDVNRLAAEWGGGGHQRAAGAEIEGDLNTVKETVLNKVLAGLS